jgi:hypothetical protein
MMDVGARYPTKNNALEDLRRKDEGRREVQHEDGR